MSFRLSTAGNLLHRPHLITPQAAMYWAERLRELDGRAFRRTSRFDALAKKLGFGRPAAMEDDDIIVADSEPASTRPDAYAPMWMGEPDKCLDWGWSVKDGVAMMEIAGPLVERGGWGWCDFMHGYDTIAAAIDEFDADTSAKAGLIRFDTPGGVVASGIYDLAAKLQARGPDAKPLWAICEMACSAGYWIASQFDRVLAPQAGLVGSIGVVMVHENHAGALEKFGVEITSVEFPEGGFKTDGAWWKALSEAGRAALQSDINELGAAFLATVEAGRGGKLSAGQAKALGAQVFPAVHSDKARDATALGLIDGVMSEREAFEALKAEVSATASITLPASAGATAAPAASTTETDMKRSARIAAVMAGKTSAKTDSEKLDEIRKILDTTEDDDTEAEGEDTGEGGDTPVEEEEKPDASAALARAQAILALPEAKGRDALAQSLAFDADFAGLSLDKAKATLAKAPLASKLADRMTDPKITADASRDSRSEAAKVADEALAAAGFGPARK